MSSYRLGLSRNVSMSGLNASSIKKVYVWIRVSMVRAA